MTRQLHDPTSRANRTSLRAPANAIPSGALKRLREALGDELFLRMARGMQPTPLAESLAEPVASAIDTLRAGSRDVGSSAQRSAARRRIGAEGFDARSRRHYGLQLPLECLPG